jgi:hypothetical protein
VHRYVGMCYRRSHVRTSVEKQCPYLTCFLVPELCGGNECELATIGPPPHYLGIKGNTVFFGLITTARVATSPNCENEGTTVLGGHM